MKLIKIFPDSSSAKNYCADGILRLVWINNASDVDGEVLMTSNSYNDVFKTTKKTAANSLKRLSVVKISANDQVIYRAYRGVSATDFLKDYVALSPNSIMLLNDKDGKEPQEVEVSKGCQIPFYWYHPDKAVRLSVKLGFISVLLGIVSIVVSVIGLLN